MCVCVPATALFHYFATSVLLGSYPRHFRRPSGLGVKWRTEEDAGVWGGSVLGWGWIY